MRNVYQLASAPVYDFTPTERAAIESLNEGPCHSSYLPRLNIIPGKAGAVAQFFRDRECNFTLMICKRPIKDGLIYDLHFQGQPKLEYHAFANAIVECRRIINENSKGQVIPLFAMNNSP